MCKIQTSGTMNCYCSSDVGDDTHGAEQMGGRVSQLSNEILMRRTLHSQKKHSISGEGRPIDDLFLLKVFLEEWLMNHIYRKRGKNVVHPILQRTYRANLVLDRRVVGQSSIVEHASQPQRPVVGATVVLRSSGCRASSHHIRRRFVDRHVRVGHAQVEYSRDVVLM